MMPKHIRKAMDRWVGTIRDRALFAKYLANDPQYAIAYVNEKLDKASRGEEERANFLEVSAE